MEICTFLGVYPFPKPNSGLTIPQCSLSATLKTALYPKMTVYARFTFAGWIALTIAGTTSSAVGITKVNSEVFPTPTKEQETDSNFYL